MPAYVNVVCVFLCHPYVTRSVSMTIWLQRSALWLVPFALCLGSIIQPLFMCLVFFMNTCAYSSTRLLAPDLYAFHIWTTLFPMLFFLFGIFCLMKLDTFRQLLHLKLLWIPICLKPITATASKFSKSKHGTYPQFVLKLFQLTDVLCVCVSVMYVLPLYFIYLSASPERTTYSRTPVNYIRCTIKTNKGSHALPTSTTC